MKARLITPKIIESVRKVERWFKRDKRQAKVKSSSTRDKYQHNLDFGYISGEETKPRFH